MLDPDDQKVLDGIRAHVRGAVDAGGAFFVGRVQARLNTPYPPASKPGEAPHRRTGRLRAGVSYEVKPADAGFDLSVDSEAPYTEHLVASGRDMYGTIADDAAAEIDRLIDEPDDKP